MAEMKLLLSYLLLIALAVALASCTGDAPGMQATSKADRNDIRITVQWLPRDRVDAACKAAGARDGQNFNACAASGPKTCTIYAVQPHSFSDQSALQALGHEAWHCFGARHN